MMDCTCHQLLAGAALARNENSSVGLCDSLNKSQQLSHGSASDHGGHPEEDRPLGDSSCHYSGYFGGRGEIGHSTGGLSDSRENPELKLSMGLRCTRRTNHSP